VIGKDGAMDAIGTMLVTLAPWVALFACAGLGGALIVKGLLVLVEWKRIRGVLADNLVMYLSWIVTVMYMILIFKPGLTFVVGVSGGVLGSFAVRRVTGMQLGASKKKHEAEKAKHGEGGVREVRLGDDGELIDMPNEGKKGFDQLVC